MKGADYIATCDLSTREGIVAKQGERCDFVPVQSLPWLLECGAIAPAPAQAPTKATKTGKGQ